MKITRTSIISGITRTMDIPIEIEDYEEWENGRCIQYAAPYLSDDQREFMISGITAEEWAPISDYEGEWYDEY